MLGHATSAMLAAVSGHMSSGARMDGSSTKWAGVLTKRMRVVLAALVLVLCSGIVGAMFWYMDLIYDLPTPVPSDHRVVEVGTPIQLRGALAQPADKPVFLHFFNPRCPCSRFNMPAVRSLIERYRDRVAFRVVVVLPEGKTYPVADLHEKFGADIPISFDRSVAASCGVYSTPQAVLIDAEGRLFYRGNYNKHRYCTAEASNYARLALEALLGGSTMLHLEQAALLSYGCALPVCTKE